MVVDDKIEPGEDEFGGDIEDREVGEIIFEDVEEVINDGLNFFILNIEYKFSLIDIFIKELLEEGGIEYILFNRDDEVIITGLDDRVNEGVNLGGVIKGDDGEDEGVDTLASSSTGHPNSSAAAAASSSASSPTAAVDLTQDEE